MKNTKMLLIMLGALVPVCGWLYAHTYFWHWLLGSSLWAFAGSMLTGAILPMLAAALYADLKEGPTP